MPRPALLLVVVLLFSLAAPVHAQDGFTPEEQIALDEIRVALEQFASADTYTLDIEQKVDQNIVVTALGQKVTLDQVVGSSGTMQFASAPGNTYPNRQMDLTQTIQSNMQGTGSDQQQTVGPIRTQLVVLDDRIYIKMDVPTELQSAIPSGWHDVTEGADQFPGLQLFDLQGLLDLGTTFGPDYVNDLLVAVTHVEIQAPESVEGRAVNHYRLTFDPVLALQSIGASTVAGMFRAEQAPFDVAAFIDLLYADEDTTYVVDFSVYADDHTLYRYVEQVDIDVLIPSDLFTDPSLQGAEMTLVQGALQALELHDVGLPVTIEAPDLGEN